MDERGKRGEDLIGVVRVICSSGGGLWKCDQVFAKDGELNASAKRYISIPKDFQNLWRSLLVLVHTYSTTGHK